MVLCMLSHCHTGQSNYIINYVVLYVQNIINCTPLSPLLKSNWAKGLKKKLEWLVPALIFHSVFRTTASRLSQWEGEVSICTGIYSLHYCEVVHTSYWSTDWFLIYSEMSWLRSSWKSVQQVGGTCAERMIKCGKKNSVNPVYFFLCWKKSWIFPSNLFILTSLLLIPPQIFTVISSISLHC